MPHRIHPVKHTLPCKRPTLVGEHCDFYVSFQEVFFALYSFPTKMIVSRGFFKGEQSAHGIYSVLQK